VRDSLSVKKNIFFIKLEDIITMHALPTR
jgi:hypothetical protein